MGSQGGGTVGGHDYRRKDCYLRALELDPKNANSWTHLGVSGGGTVGGRNYREADCYLRALELDPNNARAWNCPELFCGGTEDDCFLDFYACGLLCKTPVT